MFHSILVPLDGSTFGEHALPLAVSIARHAGAKLQLVHVHVSPAPLFTERRAGFDNTLGPALLQRSRSYLEEVAARVEAVSDVAVIPGVLEGDVQEAIHQRVLATSVDLVVMSTHGRGPLARAWLGSVADGLVRRLTVPVLLVRPKEGPLDLGGGVCPRHVLVPLDGSPLAEKILEPAVALGSLANADYTLLRVVRPPGLTMVDPTGAGLDARLMGELQEVYEEERAEAEKYLNRVAAPLRARPAEVRTEVLAVEQPAAAILHEVRARGVDLVALETHARKGLPRLLLGSIADKLVRGSDVPVLLHRPAFE
jgi:nucleotide-binding universal stress UspA family protein